MFVAAEKPSDVKALTGAAKDIQTIARLALGMTTENNGLSKPDGSDLNFGLKNVDQAQIKTALEEALRGMSN
jgi:hypothetical protein